MGTELKVMRRTDLPSGTMVIGRKFRVADNEETPFEVIAVSNSGRSCSDCVFRMERRGGCYSAGCESLVWMDEIDFLTSQLTK